MAQDPSPEAPLTDRERIDRLEKKLEHAYDRIDALELRTAGMNTHKPAPPPQPDAELQALKVAMLTAFKAVTGYAYAFDGAKDAMALKRLVKMANLGEVTQRWRSCLGLGDRYPGTRSIAVFAARFNNFAPAKPAAKPAATLKTDPYANR